MQAVLDVRYRRMYSWGAEGYVSTLLILQFSSFTHVRTGGVGVVVYFRKEGRALGEVTKYVSTLPPPRFSPTLTAAPRYPRVQPAQAARGDSADKYFKSTELIAGVKDMRFQALMPDVLHWPRDHQGRQDGQHERHEVRRDREERDPHLEAVRYPRYVFELPSSAWIVCG